MIIAESEIPRLKQVVEEDFLYEDYAWVLTELSSKGIKTVRCDVWCEDCEEEFEVEVNTKTLDWTCPDCGGVSDQ